MSADSSDVYINLVTMNSRQRMVSVHPATSAFEIEGKDFKEPGTGLLMIRPWGSHNLAMIIAGVDDQGLEIAARLFPKRTGLLVPDWGKKGGYSRLQRENDENVCKLTIMLILLPISSISLS